MLDSIPPEFGKLEHLQSLDRSKNFLGGTIPSMLGGLKRLERLNSSHNNLSDDLSSFGDMLSLIFVDVSYNQLKGSLPNIPAFRIGTIETLRNNQDLCGNVSGLEPCPKASKKSQNHKTNKVILVFLPVGLGTLILALFAFGVSYRLCRSSKTKEHQDAKPPGQNLFVIWSFDGKMCLQRRIAHRSNFSYQETPLVQNREMSYIKAFTSEIQALVEIQHHNIVKLYGFFSHSQFLFLVYELSEKGSMNKILKDNEQAIAFDWNWRIKANKGVTSALCYMHHDYSPPIVHQDISSKNVVLDLEYILEQPSLLVLIQPIRPHLLELLDMLLQLWDISIGNTFWEHPGDFITSLLTSSSNVMNSTLDISSMMGKLDQHLPYPANPIAEEIVLIARIANACLTESPCSWPTMEQVEKELAMSKSSSLHYIHMFMYI
ncbi:MDIS1-interacting receptor like kinase 2 [Glycine soja]